MTLCRFFQVHIVQTLPDTFYEFPIQKNKTQVCISGSKYQQEYPNVNSNVKTLQVDSSSGKGALEKNGYFTAGVAGLYIANCSLTQILGFFVFAPQIFWV